MGLRIATNVPALSAQRNLYAVGNAQQTAMARLPSGYRINKASDDAAGLAISENLKAQIRGFRQANRNANDGISLVQVAEGGMSEVSNMLIRLRELSIQSASDTISDNERAYTNIEYQQLKEEIDRTASSTKFNGVSLLGGQGGTYDFQVGNGNNEHEDRISFDTSVGNATTQGLGIHELTVANKLGAQESLGFLDEAINKVNGARANYGALQSRLQSTAEYLMVAEENYSAANSRIRDTDMAAESSNLAKSSILQQAATSVLSQANTQQQLALKLLAS
ncbi:MAG: flagellin FliC [Bdellovibrionaceae bacterium]|nr:flagellin FliC [Pseudobdellovibrionaceae bacterium]